MVRLVGLWLACFFALYPAMAFGWLSEPDATYVALALLALLGLLWRD